MDGGRGGGAKHIYLNKFTQLSVEAGPSLIAF